MQLQPIGAASFADAFSELVRFVSSTLTRGGLKPTSALAAASLPLSLITVVVQVAAPAATSPLIGGEG